MALAKQLLGRQAYVGWPHLVEAKIHSLSDGTNHYQVGVRVSVHGRVYITVADQCF